ncbi:2-amino-4-hydroxy-6-hydroxymethyldihydropteridine diphosphokinase [Idiomarina xiamenensis]|uniref:2-amino-4-hydroxy-6-hydroxymethyldihydropteridine pyrophosphokinase n=1 Tax=Idiomarina xiamenensis 10-D-4 TaxID=740709 RepID=K2KYY6_9GAMM|nr:2-amino-4-hydroxy-6-hydroxymethyldihydropteridine diphosphokinase [Idiomarina xiamenensis]EKE82945.1 7,8-dihydro-6-hydroxymethylpterin-pyrophosphokinase [Idiomarina xiamenensis 10-D-4]
MRYLCSLGSNLQAAFNIERAQQALAQLPGQLYTSAVIKTKPVAIDTDNDFLNALFIIDTPLNATQLKQYFNAIEIAQGRDRDDPRCSEKDRPIDIDILSDDIHDNRQVPDYLQALYQDFYAAIKTQLGASCA